MQHAVKSKVLAAALSVMIAITFMPWYLWQTSDSVHAAVGPTSLELVVGNTDTITSDDDVVNATSNNEDVATVTFEGKEAVVEAVSKGVAEISIDSNSVVTKVSVTVEAQVAELNGLYYASLEEAVAAAKEGDVVNLVADASIKSDIVVNDNITIDLHRFNIKNVPGGAKIIKVADQKTLVFVATNKVLGNPTYDSATVAVPIKAGNGAIIAEDEVTLTNANENSYVATFAGKTYIGLYAFEQAYELAKDQGEPIVLKKSQPLTNVPAGVTLRNNTDTELSINADKVPDGETFDAAKSGDYKVIFDAQGGTFKDTEKGKKEEYVKNGSNTTISEPDAPEKEGYIFDGWYEDELVKYQFEYETDSHKTTTATIGAESVFKTSEGKYVIILADGTPIHNATLVKSTAYDFSQPVTKSMTLYAHWFKDLSTVNFTVDFDLAGGKDAATGEEITTENQIVTFGEKVNKPVAPEKDNGTFEGWYNGEKKWNFNTDRVYSDLTLTAKWSQSEYSVAFDLDGGELDIESQINVEAGSTIENPGTPTKKGSKFLGWYNGDKKWSFNEDTVESNMTLTAKWAEKHIVTIYADETNDMKVLAQVYVEDGHVINDGVKAEDSFDVKWFAENGKIKLAEMEAAMENLKEGYKFLGFYTKDGEEFDLGTKIYDNTAIYGHWAKNYFNVHFDLNGGEKNEAFADQVVKADAYATEPAIAPVKKGYTFLGWFKKGSDVAFDFNEEAITANTTLTAKWEEKPLVTIYADDTNNMTVLAQVYVTKGGVINGAEKAEDKFNVDFFNEKGKVIIEKIYEDMDNLRDGYTFLGFYTKDGEAFDLGTKIYDNTSIYGHWAKKADNRVVFYDITSGYRVPVAVMNFDEDKYLSKDEIYGAGETSLNGLLPGDWKVGKQGLKAPTGYEFVGFYNNNAYKNDAYTKANEWDYNMDKIEGNTNIYLKYKPVEYKIVFDRGAEDAKVVDGAEAKNGALSWLSEQKTYTQTVTFNKETQLDACKYERPGFVFDGWKLYNIKSQRPVSGLFPDEALINANIDENQYEVVKTPEDLYLEGETANYVFVAQWTPVKYAVVYLPNGGEGTPYGQHLTYNNGSLEKGSTTLENKFTKAGYHFIGWSTKEVAEKGDVMIHGSKINETAHLVQHPCNIFDGKQTLVKHHSIDTNLTTVPLDEPIKLYAQWVPCDNYSYTITTWTEIYKQNEKGENIFPSDLSEARKWANELGQVDQIVAQVKKIGDSWYYPTIKKCVGTTDETVTAETAKGFLLDTENSTKDLTIVLSADKYADACVAEPFVIEAANIDVVAKGIAKPTAPVLPEEEVLPEGQTLVYNAKAQQLVTEGKTSYGIYQYAIVPNTPAEPEWEKVEWSTEIPTAVDAGTYRVASYIQATDEAHKDSKPVIVASTIDQKTVELEWGKLSFSYDGLYHVPTAEVTNLCDGDTCVVTVDEEQLAIGNYDATASKLSNSNYKLPEDTTVTERKFDIVETILLAKATPSGSNKIKVSWTGVSGATKYEVYGINCGKATVYKYNGAFGTAVKSVTFKKVGGKKIKAHKSYKFYVVAYAGNEDIATSNTMHCIAAKTMGSYANPTSITAQDNTIVIDETGIGGVAAKVKVPKKKKILGTNHIMPYRYLTSDPGIAEVDELGTVTAVHAGTCMIYTQTVNGMWCGTRVIVQ